MFFSGWKTLFVALYLGIFTLISTSCESFSVLILCLCCLVDLLITSPIFLWHNWCLNIRYSLANVLPAIRWISRIIQQISLMHASLKVPFTLWMTYPDRSSFYHKTPNKRPWAFAGNGAWERTFSPSSSFLRNENWTIFSQDIVKNVRKHPNIGSRV